jgi:DNA-binding response OmpR family regulator
VLIAEDDAELRQLMAKSLAEDGYEIDEASTGFELLVLLARPGGHYDIVVSDIRMPGLTGLEVIDDLRAHREFKDSMVAVILVTAFPDLQARAEAGRLQAMLLEKPLDMDELRNAVADLIDPTQIVS